MYNRYVAQPDGSFRKTSFPDPEGRPCSPSGSAPPDPPLHCFREEKNSAGRQCPSMGIGSFFRNLFPKGLDTEDLIVILLLLLLSQDGGKNGNRALLTLGAYLFL